jgi:hypothetical protein
MAAAQETSEHSWSSAIRESLFGDVYANPERWRPLSLGTFFSAGWNTPWVSPPNGGGGAPRQGWLNADRLGRLLALHPGVDAERLKASGTTTEVLLVPGAGRLFNFRQSEQAAAAWDATLKWLDRYLR